MNQMDYWMKRKGITLFLAWVVKSKLYVSNQEGQLLAHNRNYKWNVKLAPFLYNIYPCIQYCIPFSGNICPCAVDDDFRGGKVLF